MTEINELAAALAKAQGEIQPAPKDALNPYFKSRYASLPAVREAVREAFAKHGLSVVQIPAVIDGTLRLRTMLLHESGQQLDCGELSAEVDVSNPQQMGSAITYFRRYALAAISQTVADDDDDGNAATKKPKPQPQPLPRDTKQIDNAKKGIAEATSLEELQAIGEALKDRSPAIQNALRKAWGDRHSELKKKEKTDADSRSDQTTDPS